jgi:hypothetical protein
MEDTSRSSLFIAQVLLVSCDRLHSLLKFFLCLFGLADRLREGQSAGRPIPLAWSEFRVSVTQTAVAAGLKAQC